MKNILKVTLLLLITGSVASCNLDRYPEGSAIPAETSFTTFKHAQQFRLGLYSYARSCFSAYTVIPVNIQTEDINATMNYGNTYGTQYAWTFLDNDSVIESIWTNCYAAIYQINFFLQKSAALIAADDALDANDPNKMSVADRVYLNLYIGEAHLFRAMIYHQLATFYCKDYEKDTAASDWGLILTDEVDIYARKSRSTLAATYTFINDDLTAGLNAMDHFYNRTDNTDEELSAVADRTSQANYLDYNVAQCLQAKILFHMDEYEEAATLAATIADRSTLLSDETQFQNMWENNPNTNTEVLFQFYASLNEGRSDYGAVFLYDPAQTQGRYPQSMYIPTQWILGQYDTNDIRYKTYFKQANVMVGTSYASVMVVNKYPGNPAYNASASVNEFMQNVVLYRSADFVLMAAEAYAMNNDVTNANLYLSKLQSARIPNYTYEPYASADEALEAIKLERLKEMFMEGNRIADLKRWKEPMNRAGHDPQSEAITVPTGRSLNIAATDYRFVWPIPQSEQDANPSVKDQLNWK